MPVAVVDLVQVLDQQVAPARRIAEQRLHFLQRLRIDGAALRNRADFAFHREAVLSGSGRAGFLDCGQARLSGMKYRVLGATGVQVSQLASAPCRSAAMPTQRESARMYRACRDAGINFFDTADQYNKGRSEEILGELIRGERDEPGHRHQVLQPDRRRRQRARRVAPPRAAARSRRA